MKKITLLIIALLFSVAGFSQFPTPGTEGFEGTTGPDLAAPTTPSPWTLGTGATGNQWAVFDNGVGLTRRWNITAVAANVYAGTNSAFMDRENIGIGNTSEDYLATPLLTVPANGQLRFWTRSTISGANGTEYLIKVYDNAVATAGAQTTAANYTLTPQQWTEATLSTTYNVYEEKVVDLSAFAGHQVHIAFVMRFTQPTASLGGDRWLIDDIRLVQQCFAPSALGATPQSTTANLTWTDATGTSWEIEVVPGAAGVPTGVPTGTSNTTSYIATSLTANSPYTFYVRSVCGPGLSSAWAGPFAFSTSVAPIGCGGNFVDSGGSTGAYSNNENITTAICPSNTTDLVTVAFTSFATEAGFDVLSIYDGSSATAPLLGSYSGTNVPPTFTSSTPGGCLTFVFTSDGSVTGAGWVTNITCAPPPTCPKPTALVTSGVTSNSGTLTWTNNSTATQFEVLALPCTSPAPTATTSGTLITPTSNTYTFTGLNADTCYTLYVRAVCSATDSSVWSVSSNIQTQITPPACGGTFTDPGGATANYANSTDSTVTICPTVAGQVVTVTFTSFNTEATWDGLYVFNGNSITAPQIPSANGAGNVPGGLAGSYWGTTIPGPFTSTSPDGCLTFRFRSDASVNNPGWVANVTCALPPTCPGPTVPLASAVTSNSGTLSWTNNSTATQFEVLALPCTSPAPTATSTGTIVTPTTPNTYTFTGLTPDTCYTLYVRAVCSPTDSSTWTVGVNIQTQIAPPACGGTFTDPGGATANYANSTDYTVTICPTIPGQQVTVTFTDFFTEATWDGLYVYDGNSTASQLLPSTNPAGNVPGGLAGSYWGNLTGANLPGPFTSSSPTGCLTFRFRSDASVNDPGWIANVTCAPPPTCPRPTAVVVSNQGQTSATIGWTEVGSATTWEVLILPAGSPVPTAASTGVLTNTNPYLATGLNSGTSYIVYVRAICSSSDISNWSNVGSFTTLIANDECANAIVAPVNPTTTCTQTVGGTVIGATNSADPTTCGGTHDDDVWFQFTATSTTHTISLLNITGSTTDLFHVVYSGTCGSLTQLYCSDPNTSTANNLVPGQTYYVRVYTYTSTANQTSAFSLCIGTPVPPPSCINNTPAGNSCATATPICNLNGYCGNTSASYSPTHTWPELTTAFCGSLENNSFLTFIATSSTISFDVWVTSSQTNGGIQIMLFSAATCGSGPVTNLTCWSPGNVPVGSTNISASGLTPGNAYYIMVDGFAGDVCSYVIASNSGIQTPVLINTTTSTTTNTVCLGQSATLNASGGNGVYTWTPATGLNTTSGSTVVFTPTAVGTYSFTATSTDNNPLCPQSASSTQTLVVTAVQTPTFNQIPSFCDGTTAPVLPTTSQNGITGTWSPSTVSNTPPGTTTYTFTPDITQCATPTTMDITVNPGVTPLFLSPAPICSGATAPVLPTTSQNGITGSWSPSTVSNTASGTYTFTPDPGQCSSTVTLNVTVNTNCSFGSYASAVWLTNCATSNFFNTVGSGTDIIGPAANIFPNTNLGTYVQNSSSLILRGAEVKTFKNASSNVCSARLNYRIYPQATTPGTFNVMDLPFFDNCGGATFPSGGPCQAGDQKWQRVVANGTTTPYSPVDLTLYPPGNYVLEVYYDVSGSASSTSLCNETVLVDNNGANYMATFTIQNQPAYASTNPTTCSGTDGTITISGLAPGTNYSLTYNDDTVVVGPTTITTNASGEITLTGLNSGTYSNFLLEINSCSYSYNTPIVLVDPALPSVTVNSVTVCQGSPATITATPDVAGNYVYTWTVPTGAVNPGNVASFNAALSGTYSVTVTSVATGCTSSSATSTVVINPTPTVTVNNPMVCEGNPATVIATPGNSGTYSYAWTVPTGASDPGNVNTFDASLSGTYSVIITDTTTGCSSVSVSSVVIINPTPTITVNSPTICQGQTATVTATVAPSANYTYTWSVPAGATNPGNVSTFPTTTPGTYTVSVNTSNNFCNQDFEDPCGVPSGGMSFVNQSSFNCWQTTATDGIIEVWSSGNEGVTSYSGTQFVELNANQVSSLYQNFSVLPGSTVDISFAHRGRFSGTDVMELQVGPVGGPYVSLGQFSAQPAAWVYSTVVYTFPNNGVSNYTVRFVSVSSGSGNNTVGNFIDAVSFTTLNCPSLPASGTVTINPTVVPTFTAIAPLCVGDTAPLLSTSSNNTTPVTGTWSPSTIDTSVAGTNTYVFTPDAGQCSGPISINVTVNSVATPTVVVVTQPTCAVPTGVVQVTAPVSSVGVLPTDLFISEATDSNAGSLSYIELYNGTGSTINLSNYSVKTASNGGAYSFTLPLNNVNLASGSTYVVALGNDNYCPSTPGADGSLAAQTSGSGSVNFSANGNDHFGLFNGSTLIDSWGTFGSNNWAPAIVGTEGGDFRRKNNATVPNTNYNNNDWDIYDYAGTGTTACSNNDYSNIGSFTPLTTTNTYQYNVDGGTYQSNPIFTGLTPGSHIITVQDTATGCISTGVTVVLDPVVQNPSVTTISYTSPVCINVSSTLTPDTTATGFTTGGTYTATPAGLTIDPSTGVVDLTTSTPGTYTITYSVSANTTLCLLAGSSQFTLVINPLPTVTVNSPSVCQGTAATITATPGSVDTYSYVWTVPTGAVNPGDVASFTTTVAGTYSVVITNTTTGCTSASASGVVTINPTPTVSVNSTTVCQGSSAPITATPGTSGTYTYVWTVPSGATNPGNVATFNASVAGNYDVIITDTTTGCSSVSATGTLTVNPNPVVTVTGETVCQGSQATISAVPTTTGTYTYVWTVPTGATNPGNVDTFTTAVAGTYSVVITDTTTGCVSLSASGIAAFVPAFDFAISEGCVGNNYTLEVVPTTGSFNASSAIYSWYYGTTSVGSNSSTFNVTEYLNSTTVVETLPLMFSVDVSSDGCIQSHTITITRTYCDIQRGISPNGDGLNDSFDLTSLGVQQLSIFNRYGTKVYSKGDYTNQWHGQSDSDNELPDGTYYYVIEFKNNQSSKTGWIYINRENK